MHFRNATWTTMMIGNMCNAIHAHSRTHLIRCEIVFWATFGRDFKKFDGKMKTCRRRLGNGHSCRGEFKLNLKIANERGWWILDPSHLVLVERENGKNYSTSYSHVISHHSTDDAITSLTSEIERDPVLSSMYGRSWKRRIRLFIKRSKDDLVLLWDVKVSYASDERERAKLGRKRSREAAEKAKKKRSGARISEYILMIFWKYRPWDCVVQGKTKPHSGWVGKGRCCSFEQIYRTRA